MPEETTSQVQGGQPEQLAGQEQATQFSAEYVKELRNEAAEWRTKFRDMEKAIEANKADRERQQLEAKGDYETALQKATERAAQLETQAETAERYSAALKKYVNAEREGLPEYITALLDKMDAVDQLEWLATNKASVIQPAQTQTPQSRAGQVPFNPQGQAATLTDAERVQRLNRQRGTGVTPF